MADPRTFVLIGNFTDNITPALEKINKSLEQVKTNLESVAKVTKPLKSDFRELADYSKDFSKSLKSQASDLRDVTNAMRAFRSEMGRVNRAYRAGGNRVMRQAAATAPAPIAPTPTPRRSRGGGGGYAAAVGGGVAGMQLGDMMTGSIVRGFQLGVSIMMRPFQYAGNAFAERIRDELTDIQSAGGLFAVDQRKNLGMFRDFQQARVAQEEINYRLAKSAAALPGATAQYVQEAKRVTDTMIGAMAKQPQQFMKLGEEFGAKTGDKMDALGAVIQKFTEKTVLLGKGGGGYRGIYSMPMLLEMMVNRPTVSAQSMGARYAVLRDNPMLMAAIQDAEDEINKTGAGTAERLRVLMKVLDEALPNEVIQGMKNSMDGIIEVIRSSFLDPEVGLFGLGRKMKEIGPAVDQFGRYVNEQGKVVPTLAEAAKADLSLFAIIRDILGGFALPLSELAQILPELFDPLRKIGEGLIRFRNVAQRFYANFNQYTAEFEALSKEIGGKAGAQIKRTAGARGALLSVANLLRGIGAMDVSKYTDVAKKLQEPDVKLGEITGDLFKALFNSDVMKTLGEAVGTVVGSTLKMVGDLMTGVTGMASTGPFAAGLKKGWDESGGAEGIANIFKSLFKVIGELLITAFKAAPLESTILASLTVGLPLLSGLLSSGITALFEMLFKGVPGILRGAQPKGAQALAQAGGGGFGGGFFQTPAMRRKQLRAMARARRAAQTASEVGQFGVEAAGLGYNVAGRPGAKTFGRIGRAVGKVGKFVPGGAVAAGAIDMAASVASGENFGKAAIGAFGTVLGGAAGSIFGPAGTVIGSIAGGMLADAASNFVTNTLDQNKAAAMQMEAARKQVEAASVSATTKYGPKFGEKLGGVEALNQALGGGAGVKAYAEEQLRLGKITAEQAQNWGILSKQLTDVNTTTSKVEKAQKEYDTAVKLNTGQQEKYKKALEVAQRQQQAALSKITANWEQMSATNRTKLLQGADNIRAALDEAAAKIRGWKGLPALTPPPPPRNPAAPPPTTNTQEEQRKPAPAPLDSKKLIPGLPATPESGYGAATGRLGDAIASEMRMKPPGSDLVIANTSETIIPAAGGYGMLGFVETLRSGFSTISSVFIRTAQQTETHFGSWFLELSNSFKQANERQVSAMDKINSTLIANQKQTNVKLSKLESKFTSPMIPGGLGGGAAGGVDAFTPIAQNFGLQMTSGYRPGDSGWHGANRARDYSNGTGPTPQMMQFAQYMASAYGGNLKELIYTPLGFSIKDGQRVAPYAQGSHYNHVHVAYALGAGMPAFFTNEKDAVSWENKFLGNGIKSITTNTAELAQLRYGSTPKPGGGASNWMKILEEDYQKNLKKPINPALPRTSGRGYLDMWEGPGTSFVPSESLQSGAAYRNTAAQPINITAPITINQQPGQSADELASIVALKIGEAVADARAASIFV